VTKVLVTGINKACKGRNLYLILTTDGVNIGDTDPRPPGQSVIKSADIPIATRAINEKPAAADVNDVHVCITTVRECPLTAPPGDNDDD
jgi:hypothetical protein